LGGLFSWGVNPSIGTKGIREKAKNGERRVDTRIRGIKEVAKKALRAV